MNPDMTQGNALLSMLGGGAGAGMMNPMGMMMPPGMGGMGGGMPTQPMNPQMPPGLEGLSPEEIQMVLAMLQQQGLGGQSLQDMLGQGGMPPMAGAMAPMNTPQDMPMMPGGAAAPMQSY